ncbi:uncharacterized protein LOC142351102 [Convolutriloba macropyga]|uniref:uncharacterized protein LOC142351102 n=1 Tax=Convolutriloba macropyga TaxID=536237 RepID=UPI003F51AFC1
MAALAPFGTDSQPNTRAILKGGKLMYVPSYTSQRNKTEELMQEYTGDVPYYPPTVRTQEYHQDTSPQHPLWAKRSPLPPIVGSVPSGPFHIRETERSDGHFMEGVKWQPEKINSNADMSQAIQVKRLLEGWPRAALKKIYLSIAENYDRGLTDQVYRGDLASVCIACRLPLTARVLERLFDRFSLVRDPNNVDYKKMLIYLDTVFEVADFKKKPIGSSIAAEPLRFPLPAPSQQAKLDSGELSQTFREVQERTTRRNMEHENGQTHTAAPNQSNENNCGNGSFQKTEQAAEEFPMTEEITEARTDIRNSPAPYQHHPLAKSHQDNLGLSPALQSHQNSLSPKPSTPQLNTKIDTHDAELLTLLVSHLSKKGRNMNLKNIKKAFYDADLDKTTFLYRGKVRDILRKHSVSLDDWLLEAFLNRCDIDNTGVKTCWIAIIEFLERVQPFTLKKNPLAATNQNADANDQSDPFQELSPTNRKDERLSDGVLLPGRYSDEFTMQNQHVQNPMVQDPVDGFPTVESSQDNYEQSVEPSLNDGTDAMAEQQMRVQNLTRALKSVDIDNTGFVQTDEALRLLRNYNTVYQLGMDDFDIMRMIQNATHQGQVIVDSLCDNLRLENSLHY